MFGKKLLDPQIKVTKQPSGLKSFLSLKGCGCFSLIGLLLSILILANIGAETQSITKSSPQSQHTQVASKRKAIESPRPKEKNTAPALIVPSEVLELSMDVNKVSEVLGVQGISSGKLKNNSGSEIELYKFQLDASRIISCKFLDGQLQTWSEEFIKNDNASTVNGDSQKTEEELRQEKIKAQFSPWDGSHLDFAQAVQNSMNDPDSFEHVKTVYIDKGDYLAVEMTYRGKNAFGGVITKKALAKVDLIENKITWGDE